MVSLVGVQEHSSCPIPVGLPGRCRVCRAFPNTASSVASASEKQSEHRTKCLPRLGSQLHCSGTSYQARNLPFGMFLQQRVSWPDLVRPTCTPRQTAHGLECQSTGHHLRAVNMCECTCSLQFILASRTVTFQVVR